MAIGHRSRALREEANSSQPAYGRQTALLCYCIQRLVKEDSESLNSLRSLGNLVQDLHYILLQPFVACASLLLFAGPVVIAHPAQKPQLGTCDIHVLFLGNSFTYFNDLPAILSGLARAGHQCNLDARMVAPGGARLKDHWDKAQAHEALDSQKWDYVVLQDQSTLGVGYYFEGKMRVTSDEVFLPYAEKWADEIVRHGARPVFYLTWARKDTPDDQPALNYAYFHAAKKVGAIVAPVGLAWQQIREQRPTIDLYSRDGSHPSQAGSYLAACVMYAAIFHRSPANLSSHITGPPVNLETEKLEPEKTAVLADLPRSDAETLQAAAWQAWQSLEKNGGYVDVHPAPAPAPTFASGEPLATGSLTGTWSGKLFFYPRVGPVEMMLQFRRHGSAWKGHLTITYPVNDMAPESSDLSDLQVGENAFTFSDPNSAGVNNSRVDFHGALTGGELKGTAETKFGPAADTKGLCLPCAWDGSPPIVMLGDWILHKQNP
jgi:uncharacterized protein DUF4886